MDQRIKKANRKDIASPGFNASSNDLGVDYVPLRFRREDMKHARSANQVKPEQRLMNELLM